MILSGWVRVASYEIGGVIVRNNGGGQAFPSPESIPVRYRPQSDTLSCGRGLENLRFNGLKKAYLPLPLPN